MAELDLHPQSVANVEAEEGALRAAELKIARRRAELAPTLGAIAAEREAEAELSREFEEGKVAIAADLARTLDRLQASLVELVAPWTALLADLDEAVRVAAAALENVPSPQSEAPYRSTVIPTMLRQHPLFQTFALLEQFRVPPTREEAPHGAVQGRRGKMPVTD